MCVEIFLFELILFNYSMFCFFVQYLLLVIHHYHHAAAAAAFFFCAILLLFRIIFTRHSRSHTVVLFCFLSYRCCVYAYNMYTCVFLVVAYIFIVVNLLYFIILLLFLFLRKTKYMNKYIYLWTKKNMFFKNKNRTNRINGL